MKIENDQLVTVIVMTFRKFEKLKENINSILEQTYENIEIIISDDASDNFKKEEIESFFIEKSDNIKNIQIIHHEINIGTVKNFNNAIKMAKGEYIIPLSGDDVFFDKDVVADIVTNFKGKSILSGLRAVYSEAGTLIEIKPDKKEVEKFKSTNLYRHLIYDGNIISGASTYYRKEFLEKNGYFDERFRLLEDFPFYLKILRKGEKISCLDRVVIKYSLGGVTSSSSGISPTFKNDMITMYNIEKNENSGYDRRYLGFMSKLTEKLDNRNLKILLYIQYPDIFIIKVFSKIFKKNLFLKI